MRHAEEKSPEGSRPQRALIIDPIEETGRVESFLQGSGFEVLRFGNGSDALRAFPGLEPDLVLFDARVPREMGLDTCWEIRRKTRVPATPVIVATAPESRRRRQVPHWIVEGCDAYLEHSSRSEEFMGIIANLLEARETSAEPPPDPEEDPELMHQLDGLFEGLVDGDGGGTGDHAAPAATPPSRVMKKAAVPAGAASPQSRARESEPVSPVTVAASDRGSGSPPSATSAASAGPSAGNGSGASAGSGSGAGGSGNGNDPGPGIPPGQPRDPAVGTGDPDPQLDDLEREIESELGLINEQLSSVPLATKLKDELADADAWAEARGRSARGRHRVSEPIDFEKGRARTRGSLLTLQSGWDDDEREYEDDEGFYDDTAAYRRRFVLFVSGLAVLGVVVSLISVWLVFYSGYVDLEQLLAMPDSAGYDDSYPAGDESPATSRKESRPSGSEKSPFDTSGLSEFLSDSKSDPGLGADTPSYDYGALPYDDPAAAYDSGTTDGGSNVEPLDDTYGADQPAYDDASSTTGDTP